MFTKILIANRSEIARRIIRTCRAMGIETVAVFTPPDADAPFVHEADTAVELAGPSGYLDADAIIAAALATGAGAIHPGYGFLAENAPFARAVGDAGVTFIGPRPETIEVMGSKFEAIETMRSAGVPVAPSARIVHDEDPVETARRVGYPLVLKASHGGGGKGMRILEGSVGLFDEIMAAGREAESTFGNKDLYFEQFIPGARHIEVQVFGDRHGNAVHLHERECSIQRRFQKVIEEAPAPSLSNGLRRRLLEAAVAAATAVGYVGAGTVEFLVDPNAEPPSGRRFDEPAPSEFTFMEMNTRLQVEHPVTEAITGLDLVRLQIEIAAGARLGSQEELPMPSGHAIEARLYAERPDDGYAASTGTVHRFEVPGPVRVDAAIVDGTVLTHHYDALVAKVVSHADSRSEAIRVLARSLATTVVHGIDTNRDLLVAALEHPDFVEGRVDTGWLERIQPSFPPTDPTITRLHVGVAALAAAAARRRDAKVLGSVPSGWRNVPTLGQTVTFERGGVAFEVLYDTGRPVPEVSVDGIPLAVTLAYEITPDLVDIAVDHIRIRHRVEIVGEEIFIDSPGGASRFTIIERFHDPDAVDAASSPVAPTPGKVVAVLVAPGDEVIEGDALIVIESMKMEQTIRAPFSGVIATIRHVVGDQVDAGTVLVEIEEETDG